MRRPFIFLFSEISRNDALTLARWLKDNEVTRYLSDSQGVAAAVEQVINKVNLPVLTHIFNRDGRFFMAYDEYNTPVGFVRLVIKGPDTEMVVVIGERENWGKGLGSGVIREVLKIAFFELRSQNVVAKIYAQNIRSVCAVISAGFRLESFSSGIKVFKLTMKEYLNSIKEAASMPGKIYITGTDRERLLKVIYDQACFGVSDKSVSDLEKEISRAAVVLPRQIPRNTVTMNSRALLLLNDDEFEVSLVYPVEADLSENRLSVLSPIGTAILGYGEGDSIQWETPSGVADIHIKKLLYQPEAAGDYNL